MLHCFVKLAFHDTDTDILARMSVLVSASWNASLTEKLTDAASAVDKPVAHATDAVRSLTSITDTDVRTSQSRTVRCRNKQTFSRHFSFTYIFIFIHQTGSMLINYKQL